ncbi:putative glutathione synthetase ATP-binding domain-like protein [Haemophilus haemolyticus M19107]|nr:putative glutathione synthetase ATP-binding domain-like protein [Haemophilus haemolyticus M19107]
MNLHEYQAKQLFEHYGLPVKNGAVCQSVDEVDLVLAQLSGDKWAAKCQVHAGGRGKAGGVKLVHDVEEVRSFSEKWLGQRLVTFQTDKSGQPVNQIYFEETCDIDKEFYLSAVVDRASQKVVFIASPAGGMDIEEVAQNSPHLLHKVTIDPLFGGLPYQGRELAFKLGLSGTQKQTVYRYLYGIVSFVFRKRFIFSGS